MVRKQYPNVFTRKDDPNIYLNVMGEWYGYNPNLPPLGSGAMGDVYLGFRCKNPSEAIAVKRIKDAYANNKMIRERARQEASLAFRHPNLVEMLGYCEVEADKGPIFILSKFVKGEDINKYVRRFDENPLRVEKISLAICSVLDALDYVHSRGVVHRDVKPSNIMVENDSNVRLMDLGISRLNGGNKFSATGFIGTPEYAAPEQIVRDIDNASTHIDGTTDIYELGITFYELLAGNNPMACPAQIETLTKQLKERLPSNSKIPRSLMQVIWRATEKEQSKRYSTALDFKQAIRDALKPEPSLWQQMALWMENHMIVVVGFAGVFAIAILVILFMIFSF